MKNVGELQTPAWLDKCVILKPRASPAELLRAASVLYWVMAAEVNISSVK